MATTDKKSDRDLCRQHLEAIHKTAANIPRTVTVMEICGGHTNVIMQYGIRDLLPPNVRLISGPGCPVCVSSQHDIDRVIALAEAGIPIATYGDMLRVPGSDASLEDAKGRGARIFEVYSAAEVLQLRDAHPEIVFFGVGFETTAPMTAYLLEHGITVYSVHKLVPPAIKALLAGEVAIDGFLDPGHVSAITGIGEYGKIKVPQVVAGFSPERILRALRILLEIIREGKTETVNGYPEVVNENGNTHACALLRKHFIVAESEWRGLGVVPDSGLDVRNPELNARIKYAEILQRVPAPRKTGCRCGDVLKGLIVPSECPLFKRLCTPSDPQGPCMVSDEGTCAIYFRHGKESIAKKQV